MVLSLDIETAPEEGQPQEYALQPWRALEGKAKITCIGIARSNGEALLRTDNFEELLESLQGQTLYTWNGIFDVAWLIAERHWKLITGIHWVDVMQLWKWLDNGQLKETNPAWSLVEGAKRWCKDEPWLEAFIDMKKNEPAPGSRDEYWERRAKLDSIVTSKIADAVLAQLDARRLKSAMIAAENIPVVARSWVMGVPLNYDSVDTIWPVVAKEMRDIEFSLQLSNHRGQEAAFVMQDVTQWIPSKILRSPKQLCGLLYETWGLTATRFSEKTDAPSTDKAALTYLADDEVRVIEILRWRELNTQLTKYLQSPQKARGYLGKNVVHPSPKMFSTYTGRFTYQSKTKKKWHTGVAIHQWPRNKAFRALIVPPRGFKHVEYDAAGQESRLMAHHSGDLAMLDVFKTNKKFHAMTGSKLAGMSYEAFMVAYNDGNEHVAGEHGLYYQGKFCIAEGQLVDTDRGPVPIESVSILDKVWDGVQYVSHGGVIDLGVKEVIERDGIVGTPDHKVMTAKGWAELRAVGNDEIIRGYPPAQGASLRQVESGERHADSKVRSRLRALLLRVWALQGSVTKQSTQWCNRRVHSLQSAEASKLHALDQALSRCARSLLQPEQSQLSQLRRPGDPDVLRLSDRMVSIYHSVVAPQRLQARRHRQDQQRRALREGQLADSYAQGQHNQHPTHPSRGVLRSRGSTLAPVAPVEDRLSSADHRTTCAAEATAGRVDTGAHHRDGCDQAPAQGKARVYDIADAGPRHRFTVQGRIVSNCNLSNNFRVGPAKMRIQSRVQYGMAVEFLTVQQWQSIFFTAYPGIKTYWKAAIAKAKVQGYAESLAGRRFGLEFWSEKYRWGTESSALMHPIQGSGADMKDLALRELTRFAPEQLFWFDLHDGLHMLVPEDMPDERLLETRDMLDNIDYQEAWGVEMKVPLTWDVSVGENWSKLKEL